MSAVRHRQSAPLPRRSASPQHLPARRRTDPVRLPRVFRTTGHHRRPVRPRLSADGSRISRASHYAYRAFNRHLDLTGEDDRLAAMQPFLSMPAGIRAQAVANAAEGTANLRASEELAADARRHLELAHRLLEREPCRLIAIGGISGTEKLTLAAALASELGLRPGARVLRSGITRKLLPVLPGKQSFRTTYMPARHRARSTMSSVERRQ